MHVCACVVGCGGRRRVYLRSLPVPRLCVNSRKVVMWVCVGACGRNWVTAERACGYFHGYELFHILKACRNGFVGSYAQGHVSAWGTGVSAWVDISIDGEASFQNRANSASFSSRGWRKGHLGDAFVAPQGFTLHYTLFSRPNVFTQMDFLGDSRNAIKSTGTWMH